MRHILIVHDDGRVLGSLQRSLRGFLPTSEVWIECCNDAGQALLRCVVQEFDVVMCGCGTAGPGLAGFLRRLKSIQPEAVRLALCAADDIDAFERGEVLRYLGKTPTDGELAEEFAAAFARRGAGRT